MIKKNLFLLGCVFFISDSFADSANLPVDFEIEQPVVLSLKNNLNFGNVTPHPLKENTLTFYPDGFVFSDCQDVPLPNNSEPGIIGISGEPNSNVCISPSSSSVNLVDSDGNDILVKDFKVLYRNQIYDLSGSDLYVTLGSTGVEDMEVGGTMVLEAAQPEGDYSGSLTITVDY